jgi:hypothetical protein
MADLATQDAPFGLNQVTFTPGERVADRPFEGEEAVLHVIERIVAPLGSSGRRNVARVDARRPDGSRAQTRFLSASFLPTDTARSTGLLDHSVEVPAIWDALQLVLPGVLEDEA